MFMFKTIISQVSNIQKLSLQQSSNSETFSKEFSSKTESKYRGTAKENSAYLRPKSHRSHEPVGQNKKS